MLKRIATFLFGIGLIGLGVLLFIAPERAFAVQFLTRYWPLFLVLAGLVRVAGYLIDRHPRSPVGGLMTASIGGILMAALWRGENSFVYILGHYWFWILLAFIIGRVLHQYNHRPGNGTRPNAFTPGAIVVMLLIVGCGLSANYLSKKGRSVNNINLGIGRFTEVGDYLFGNQLPVEDEPAQSFALLPNSRLIINNPAGDVEVTTAAQQQASARIVKHIRAISEEEAKKVAQKIHLQISSSGNTYQFSVDASGVTEDFGTSIIITVPQNTQAGVEISNGRGMVKLAGLRGDHTVRDCDRAEVRDNIGRVTIENPRGAVELTRITGEVRLVNSRRNAELNNISGAINLETKSGYVNIDRISGPLQARVSDARVELNEVGNETTAANAERVIDLDLVRNSRISLREIKGAVAVSAERSHIEAEGISGDLAVETSHERVVARRVNGVLRIKGDEIAVEVEEIKSGAIIEATQDVVVRKFHGLLNIVSRRGAISLETDEKLTADIKATTERGRIRVKLPEDSGFRFDAVSSNSRVKVVGFTQINLSRDERSAKMGHNLSASAPLVSLRSIKGEIQLQSVGLALASREDE